MLHAGNGEPREVEVGWWGCPGVGNNASLVSTAVETRLFCLRPTLRCVLTEFQLFALDTLWFHYYTVLFV